MTKYATSATQAGIVALINRFYYSTTFVVNFDNGEVSNKNGLVKGVTVIHKKGRYIFQST